MLGDRGLERYGEIGDANAEAQVAVSGEFPDIGMFIVILHKRNDSKFSENYCELQSIFINKW